MNTVLLLGAGFSRNWGGWLADEAFEYLIGCAEVVGDQSLQQLLWKHQRERTGFEGALGELQAEFRGDPRSLARLLALQSAVMGMFKAMNGAFLEPASLFEFQQHQQYMVKTFLAKFDAIFTLNQDILLEHHYMDEHNISLQPGRRWDGIAIPGMRRIPPADPLHANSRARSIWVPLPEYEVPARFQPYFKLHGSSNWRSADEQSLLIVGDQKRGQIATSPVLMHYVRAFDEGLSQPGTRLMIIGYGFADVHINEIIATAVLRRGLRFFVIDPNGSRLAMSLNRARAPGDIRQATRLEKVFEQGLIGASRRLLRDTFGTDTVEFQKVQRFFG